MGDLVIPDIERAGKRTEDAWARAQHDFRRAVYDEPWVFTLFGVAGAVLGAVAFVLSVETPTAGRVVRSVITGGALVAGFLAGLGLMLVWFVVRAPYRQRNEARKQRDEGVESHTLLTSAWRLYASLNGVRRTADNELARVMVWLGHHKPRNPEEIGSWFRQYLGGFAESELSRQDPERAEHLKTLVIDKASLEGIRRSLEEGVSLLGIWMEEVAHEARATRPPD